MSKKYKNHMSYKEKVHTAINGCFYSAWHNSSTNRDVPKDALDTRAYTPEEGINSCHI